MEGRIDTSFQTLQRDLFASGLAADIGMNAFGVWLAIKSHADYNTGQAWPGMRRLSELTGLAVGTVLKSVHRLVEARLLRVERLSKGSNSRRGNTYVARERMDVRLGDRVLCTIVLDYVPATLRSRLDAIEEGVRKGKAAAEVFAECEILPGDGFEWDQGSRSLRAVIPGRELPAPAASEEQLKAPLVRKVLELKAQLKSKKGR